MLVCAHVKCHMVFDAIQIIQVVSWKAFSATSLGSSEYIYAMSCLPHKYWEIQSKVKKSKHIYHKKKICPLQPSVATPPLWLMMRKCTIKYFGWQSKGFGYPLSKKCSQKPLVDNQNDLFMCFLAMSRTDQVVIDGCNGHVFF